MNIVLRAFLTRRTKTLCGASSSSRHSMHEREDPAKTTLTTTSPSSLYFCYSLKGAKSSQDWDDPKEATSNERLRQTVLVAPVNSKDSSIATLLLQTKKTSSQRSSPAASPSLWTQTDRKRKKQGFPGLIHQSEKGRADDSRRFLSLSSPLSDSRRTLDCRFQANSGSGRKASSRGRNPTAAAAGEREVFLTACRSERRQTRSFHERAHDQADPQTLCHLSAFSLATCVERGPRICLFSRSVLIPVPNGHMVAHVRMPVCKEAKLLTLRTRFP